MLKLNFSNGHLGLQDRSGLTGEKPYAPGSDEFVRSAAGSAATCSVPENRSSSLSDRALERQRTDEHKLEAALQEHAAHPYPTTL